MYHLVRVHSKIEFDALLFKCVEDLFIPKLSVHSGQRRGEACGNTPFGTIPHRRAIAFVYKLRRSIQC